MYEYESGKEWEIELSDWFWLGDDVGSDAVMFGYLTD